MGKTAASVPPKPFSIVIIVVVEKQRHELGLIYTYLYGLCSWHTIFWFDLQTIWLMYTFV